MGKGERAAKLINRIYAKVASLDTRGSLICPSCHASEHLFCTNPDVEKQECCCIANPPVDEMLNIGGERSRGGQVKDATDVTDVQSTGRKRCAELYPFLPEQMCEWNNLAKAGGGVLPIVGCLGNKATNRHHGPDKNTLNNTAINVHRICAFCHNYWHARNDEFYGVRPAGTEPFIPLDTYQWSAHDSTTKATTEEIITAQISRKKGKP